MSRNGSAGYAPHSADQPPADQWIVARSFRGFDGSAARRCRPFRLVGIALRACLLRSDAARGRGLLPGPLSARRLSPGLERFPHCQGRIQTHCRTGSAGDKVLDVGCGEGALARAFAACDLCRTGPALLCERCRARRQERNDCGACRITSRRIRRRLRLSFHRARRRSAGLCPRSGKMRQTRWTALHCRAEPDFGDNRDPEFRAQCAAASSQLVGRRRLAGRWRTGSI